MRAPRISAALVVLYVACSAASAEETVRFPIRSVSQTFYLYYPEHRKADAPAAIVISGDGGWHGLIIEVAEYLSKRGYPAVGVDAKEYLCTMSKSGALDPPHVSKDFAAIAKFTMKQTGATSTMMVGWSEGAGLAVLGGLDPAAGEYVRGVLAIGLPELNELAWRWSDSVIYITHKAPNEPTFNSKDYVARLAPVPLMIIQSTHDEFVTKEVAQEIFARAREPKQIAMIDARDHHFTGQRPAFWQAMDRGVAWLEALARKSRP